MAMLKHKLEKKNACSIINEISKGKLASLKILKHLGLRSVEKF